MQTLTLFSIYTLSHRQHALPDIKCFVAAAGDLKSSNILLCVAPTAPYGRVAKVADFGLSRVYAAGETHKSTRTLGTVRHRT
jgi:serine/threonine protein kinase